MNKELSAGAVIVRKRSGVPEVLLIRDMNGHLTFPKGLIEKGEEAEEAAMREAREETGIRSLTYVSQLTPIRYFYVRGGERILKTVYYFAFTSPGRSTLTPQREEGISEILWMPLPDAIRAVGYPKTNRTLLAEVGDILAP